MAVALLLAYTVTIIVAAVLYHSLKEQELYGEVSPEEFAEALKEISELTIEVEKLRGLRVEMDAIQAARELTRRRFEDLDVIVPDLKATVTQNANALAAVRTQLSAAFANRKG